jgi:hypothetical protein
MLHVQMFDILPHLLSPFHFVQRNARKQEYELLASVTASDTFPADPGLEKVSQFTQQHIAGLMTESVIKGFEVINVDHHYSERGSTSQSPADLPFHGFFQVALIEQTSKWITDRLVTSRSRAVSRN